MSTIICSMDALKLERLLRIAEVAGLLGVSERTVWRLISEKELPEPVAGRGRRRIPLSAVLAYMERMKGGKR